MHACAVGKATCAASSACTATSATTATTARSTWTAAPARTATTTLAAAAVSTAATAFATTWCLTIADVFLRNPLRIAQRCIVALLATFDDRIGETAEDQLHGAHRIVVGRNHDVSQIRVTVGIENGKHRHVHARRFLHCVVFTTRVDDDQRTWETVQFAHAL